MRTPISGQLYEAFKNANRYLPSELRLRRPKKYKESKKTAAAESELDPVDVLFDELLEACKNDKHNPVEQLRPRMRNEGSKKAVSERELDSSCDAVDELYEMIGRLPYVYCCHSPVIFLFF